jgi:MFS family permease
MALTRTPITWAIYGVNGAWASFVYLSGPLAPILAEDLGVAVGAAGLVGTALAAGIATASATGPAAIARYGRDGTIRRGLVLLSILLLMIALVPTVLGGPGAFAVILGLIWVGSAGGGTVLNASTARLSDTHPRDSAQVITEANAAAAWVGLFSPLLLGAALGAGLGWWSGVVVCLIAALAALGGLVLADRIEQSEAFAGSARRPDPYALAVADEGYEAPIAAAVEPPHEMHGRTPGPADVPAAGPSACSSDGQALSGTHPRRTRLPGLFWVSMIALFAAAGSEFAINFWGSTLIQERTDAPTATATAAMSAIVIGIALGRTGGAWLAARVGPHGMLLGGFVVALGGFGLLWSATVLAVSIGGLLVVGLGLATLFPLLLDRGIELSEGRPDQALARLSLVLGLAIGGAPFVLGALGSVVSVSTALLLVPGLLCAGILGVALSRPRAGTG